MRRLSTITRASRALRGVGLALVAIAVAFVLPVLFPVLGAAATPVYFGKAFALSKGVSFGKVGLLGATAAIPEAGSSTAPPAVGVTLATKNRQAMELRSQAQALIDEIADVAKPMTLDELKKKQDSANALFARANAIAEFTGSDEIRRQGGTSGLTQVADAEVTAMNGGGKGSNWGGQRPDERSNGRVKNWKGMHERIADHANRARDSFGDVRSFLQTAVASKVAQGWRPSDEQMAFLKENRDLLRAIVGTAGDVSGGEFVLPLTQVQSIFSLANVQQGLLQRARAYNVPGRTLRIPYLKQTTDNASTTLNRPAAGEIANITIVGEGSTAPTAAPEFGQRLLNVFKYAAITQVSDELLGDDFTGELPQEFVNAVGQQTLNRVNEDITISGSDSTGATTPAGALLSGAAYNIAVTRTTGGTIVPTDLFNIYSQHTHGPNSVWLASRRTVQALYAMSLTSASLVTFLRDLRGLPEMMILGYPVVLTDLLNTIGTPGDIGLVNPDFYAFALRQALTVESSRDFAFTSDLTTYRFIVRAGGIPINTGKYAYKYGTTDGIDTHSPFVYLN